MNLKEKVAHFAVTHIPWTGTVGIGSGTTVHALIDALGQGAQKPSLVVASSNQTAQRLQAIGVEVVDFNEISQLDVYVDGADQANGLGQLIKGGGGALTREKILAYASRQFYCLVDESKLKNPFGTFPLAVEVLAMARSHVARKLVQLGGKPVYRSNFITDNGHVILDVHGLNLNHPLALEHELNQIPGVIAHGLFAQRQADHLWMADVAGVRQYTYTRAMG